MKVLQFFMAVFSLIFVSSTTYAETITIDMLNKRDDGAKMVYSQDIARVAVGDTITWLPASKGHNVEFRAGPEGANLPKKSKNNKEVSMTFDVPGIYYYWCTPHKGMGMIGLVVVDNDVSNKDTIAKAKALGKSKKKLKKLLEQL
jgi:pseudoazurin